MSLTVHGPYQFAEATRTGPLLCFFGQFSNLLIHGLLTATAMTDIVSLGIGNGLNLGVVIIISVVGFVQIGKAEQTLGAIPHHVTAQRSIIRDGFGARRPRRRPKCIDIKIKGAVGAM